MGNNSVLFMLNDQLGDISLHPREFATALIGAVNASGGEKGSTSLGGRFHQFAIPYCAHVDSVGLIAAGGNYAELIMSVHQIAINDHHKEEGHVRLLQQLADKLGYTVKKKRKR
jgi:hypothetical protein